ncbi:MAG TPA: ATP-binding cassette domain-containing protein [Candidatus Acidoferrales bacterium]|nr:ATP-binding cassette domain-containing protein [Candidatus Acidoferrales bacterium]
MSATGSRQPLLEARGLAKSYVQRRAFTGEKFHVRAFGDLNLSADPGTTLAIVGESGAGKSSLARCLALLEPPDLGEILMDGVNASGLSGSALAAIRRKVQLIFQDPATALSPRFSALEIVSEPLLIEGKTKRAECRERAIELIRQVGLTEDSARKPSLEFSGGQRQRLAIARALALEPKLLILDEALSSLDLANQRMILGLLAGLQARLPLTYIHVSHDLRLVARMADEVAVMLDGRIVEQNRTTEIFANPQHVYTKKLLEAMPPLEKILAKRLHEEVA